MKAAFLALSLLCISASASANSISEIRAMLKNRTINQVLGGAVIESIERVPGGYRIQTPGCAMEVQVSVIGAPMPGGPESITIQPGQLNCLPTGISVGSH